MEKEKKFYKIDLKVDMEQSVRIIIIVTISCLNAT